MASAEQRGLTVNWESPDLRRYPPEGRSSFLRTRHIKSLINTAVTHCNCNFLQFHNTCELNKHTCICHIIKNNEHYCLRGSCSIFYICQRQPWDSFGLLPDKLHVIDKGWKPTHRLTGATTAASREKWTLLSGSFSEELEVGMLRMIPLVKGTGRTLG